MSPSADAPDYAQLAVELIRALRGKRSQTAFSRRLGYKTNVVYLWEAKRAAPTAAGFFALAEKSGVDVRAAIATFYRGEPPWAEQAAVTTPAGAALLLNDLRGSRTLLDIARLLPVTRFALSRWLKGTAEPRLPDFLQAVEVTSLRLLDFVAALVDPAAIPCLKLRWEQLQRARHAAYDRPWSHAILRALELARYQAGPHVDGQLAELLGISLQEEHACLELLANSGQIEFRDGRWCLGHVLTIDTRRDPHAARQLKAWWSSVANQRLRDGVPGVFSYNLFAVSNADLARLEALQRAYFRELRSIVAQSEPAENVAVVNLQLFSLLSG